MLVAPYYLSTLRTVLDGLRSASDASASIPRRVTAKTRHALCDAGFGEAAEVLDSLMLHERLEDHAASASSGEAPETVEGPPSAQRTHTGSLLWLIRNMHEHSELHSILHTAAMTQNLAGLEASSGEGLSHGAGMVFFGKFVDAMRQVVFARMDESQESLMARNMLIGDLKSSVIRLRQRLEIDQREHARRGLERTGILNELRATLSHLEREHAQLTELERCQRKDLTEAVEARMEELIEVHEHETEELSATKAKAEEGLREASVAHDTDEALGRVKRKRGRLELGKLYADFDATVLMLLHREDVMREEIAGIDGRIEALEAYFSTVDSESGRASAETDAFNEEQRVRKLKRRLLENGSARIIQKAVRAMIERKREQRKAEKKGKKSKK
jgi:hypothetical protein